MANFLCVYAGPCAKIGKATWRCVTVSVTYAGLPQLMSPHRFLISAESLPTSSAKLCSAGKGSGATGRRAQVPLQGGDAANPATKTRCGRFLNGNQGAF